MNLGKNASADNLPCTFVIFGATGNLASNKLLPALYHLEAAARLAESLTIIAFSRRDWTTESWREHMRETLKGKIKGSLDTPVFERFIARFSYFKGDLNDAASYRALAERLPPESGVFERGVLSRHQAGGIRRGDPEPGSRRAQQAARPAPRGDRKALRRRPRIGADAQSRCCTSISTRSRSTASITFSARKRCRTCWCSVSPTP